MRFLLPAALDRVTAPLSQRWRSLTSVRPVPASTRQGQLAPLTSLRFLAAMAVVLFHVPYTLTRTVGWTVLPDGPLGVSFFFILSGFILSHVYGGTRFDVARFYRRRFARIYPLHVLTLFVWVVLFFRPWGNSLPDKMNSGIANVLLLHAFFSGPLFNLGYNAVSWSISVEAFFYLLFPLLARRAVCHGVFVAYVLGFLLLPDRLHTALDHAFPNFFYFNPVARLLEFSFGMVLYRGCRRVEVSERIASLAQVAGIVALLVMVPMTRVLPDYLRNLVLLLPFGLLIGSMATASRLARWLSAPLLVALGEASFALYMVHHMLFGVFDQAISRLAPNISAGLALAVAVIGAISLSVVVHYGFERPLRTFFTR